MPANSPARVYVALGSNLGEVDANLRAVIPSLKSLATGPVVASSIWSTEPEGFTKEVPGFRNAVVRFSTRLTPQELLGRLQEIEREMGRVEKTSEQYDSRTIDLDIVDFGGCEIDEPGLTLPHPRAKDRLFVLKPLAEIDPEFRFPTVDASLASLIADAPGNHMEIVSPMVP